MILGGYSRLMGKARSALLGGVIGAALGVVFAPRLGESRREAFDRLRLAARPGRGSIRAFAGTPCAAEERGPVHASDAPGQAAAPAAGAGTDAPGRAASATGADTDSPNASRS